MLDPVTYTVRPGEYQKLPVVYGNLVSIHVLETEATGTVPLVLAGASDLDNEWQHQNVEAIADNKVNTHLDVWRQMMPVALPAVHLASGNVIEEVEFSWRKPWVPGLMKVEARSHVGGLVPEWTTIAEVTGSEDEPVQRIKLKDPFVSQDNGCWVRGVVMQPLVVTRTVSIPSLNLEWEYQEALSAQLIDVRMFGQRGSGEVVLRQLKDCEVTIFQDGIYTAVRNDTDKTLQFQAAYSQ